MDNQKMMATLYEIVDFLKVRHEELIDEASIYRSMIKITALDMATKQLEGLQGVTVVPENSDKGFIITRYIEGYGWVVDDSTVIQSTTAVDDTEIERLKSEYVEGE
jgi:hypothetical protein